MSKVLTNIDKTVCTNYFAKSVESPLADLGGAPGARAPPYSQTFLRFHAVFGKNWPKRPLAPPPYGPGAPPLREILDPPMAWT